MRVSARSLMAAFTLSILAAFSPAQALDQSLIDAAKKEGRVV